MPVVVFEASQSDPVEVTAPAGARLLDLCDEHDAPIPFSCRSASCGTCRVDVIEGPELLAPPEDEEQSLLELFGDPPSKRRLCCQARLAEGEGRVVLRAAIDW